MSAQNFPIKFCVGDSTWLANLHQISTDLGEKSCQLRCICTEPTCFVCGTVASRLGRILRYSRISNLVVHGCSYRRAHTGWGRLANVNDSVKRRRRAVRHGARPDQTDWSILYQPSKQDPCECRPLEGVAVLALGSSPNSVRAGVQFSEKKPAYP